MSSDTKTKSQDTEKYDTHLLIEVLKKKKNMWGSRFCDICIAKRDALCSLEARGIKRARSLCSVCTCNNYGCSVDTQYFVQQVNSTYQEILLSERG